MGNCICVKSKEAKVANDNSRFIQEQNELKQLKESQKEFRTMLLLGAGESGKSTILKQVKCLYLDGFSTTEAARYREVIRMNVISSMKTLLEGASISGFERDMHAPEYRESVLLVRSASDTDELTPELTEAIKNLWRSNFIQAAWENSNRLQVIESAAYFFDDLDRIASSNYFPTNYDILRCRAKTTGHIDCCS